MELHIKNFAAIREAEIDFDGITVIAGENNTGKSTVGKILFALFHGFYHMPEKIQQSRWQAVARQITRQIDSDNEEENPLGTRLFLGKPMLLSLPRHIEAALLESNPEAEEECVQIILRELQTDDRMKSKIAYVEDGIREDVHSVFQYSDAKIRNAILTSEFERVFLGQSNSRRNTSPAELRLHIKKKDIHLLIQKENCMDITVETGIQHTATYIENPFILDMLAAPVFYGRDKAHAETLQTKDLKEKLTRDVSLDVVTQLKRREKIRAILQQLHQIIGGELVETDKKWMLHQDGLQEDILVRNLSTGVKAFAILDRLLESHNLDEQDVLILDEPEIHLHPEWQLVYAELIVLLQKAFNLTVLLTTHSPYFLEAIEVFSAKLGVQDKVKYYLAHMQDGEAEFDDVTKDTTRIYELLAAPFDRLDALRLEEGGR